MTKWSPGDITRPDLSFISEFPVILHRFSSRGDVCASISASGIGGSALPGLSLDVIAEAIDRGVIAILFFDSHQRIISAADQVHYFTKVESATAALIKLLDEQDDIISFGNLGHGRERLAHGFQSLQAVVANCLPQRWTPTSLMSSSGDQPPITLKRGWLFEQIEHGPNVLAAIKLIAQHGAQQARQQKSKAGRKADQSMDLLFMLLAGTFYATFGCSPSTGSDRIDPACASLCWVKEVIKRLRINVIEFCSIELSPPDPDLPNKLRDYTEVLTRCHALSDATKADYLAAGWKDWIQQPVAERWQRNFLPLDKPDIWGGTVPKWLVDVPIPTPP